MSFFSEFEICARTVASYFVVTILTFFIGASWPLLIILDSALNNKNMECRRAVVRFYGDLIFRICFKVCNLKMSIFNVHKIPDKPVVFASNHQSTVESIVFGSQILNRDLDSINRKRKMNAIMRTKLLLDFPPIIFPYLADICLQIDAYNNPYNSLKLAREYAQRKISSGEDVLIFPEGERVKCNQRIPIKVGGIYMMYKMGLPLILVRHNCGLACEIGDIKVKPAHIKFSFSDVIELKEGGEPISKQKMQEIVEEFFYDIPIGENSREIEELSKNNATVENIKIKEPCLVAQD